MSLAERAKNRIARLVHAFTRATSGRERMAIGTKIDRAVGRLADRAPPTLLQRTALALRYGRARGSTPAPRMLTEAHARELMVTALRMGVEAGRQERARAAVGRRFNPATFAVEETYE